MFDHGETGLAWETGTASRLCTYQTFPPSPSLLELNAAKLTMLWVDLGKWWRGLDANAFDSDVQSDANLHIQRAAGGLIDCCGGRQK